MESVAELAQQIAKELNAAKARRDTDIGVIAVGIAMRIVERPGPALSALGSQHQTEHLLQVFEDDLWNVQHSLKCRLTGNFRQCPIHGALVVRREQGPWPSTGRYVVDASMGGPLQLKRIAVA